MVGGEGNFIFLHPGPRTNDLVYHPLTFRPPQHTRDSSNCPRQLSSLPPPLFRPISTTAFNRFRLVRPPRWEKKSIIFLPPNFFESFWPRSINREFEKEKKDSRIFSFFFFFTLRVRRAPPLPIDTEKSGWHRRLRVTKSHPPNPWIERVVVHTSCRLFNDARGVRTIGPNWRKLFLFFRGFYTEI